jgi:hypothetical protein
MNWNSKTSFIDPPDDSNFQSLLDYKIAQCYKMNEWMNVRQYKVWPQHDRALYQNHDLLAVNNRVNPIKHDIA